MDYTLNIAVNAFSLFLNIFGLRTGPGKLVMRPWKSPGFFVSKGAITSKIKYAIKLKTSPAGLARLLQPSLAFCFSLQPMTAHRSVRR